MINIYTPRFYDELCQLWLEKTVRNMLKKMAPVTYKEKPSIRRSKTLRKASNKYYHKNKEKILAKMKFKYQYKKLITVEGPSI